MFFCRKKTIDQEIEVKVNTILTSIIDDVNSFTHCEQSIIMNKVFERFKEIKQTQIDLIQTEIESKKTTIDEIKESLKMLK